MATQVAVDRAPVKMLNLIPRISEAVVDFQVGTDRLENKFYDLTTGSETAGSEVEFISWTRLSWLRMHDIILVA